MEEKEFKIVLALSDPIRRRNLAPQINPNMRGGFPFGTDVIEAGNLDELTSLVQKDVNKKIVAIVVGLELDTAHAPNIEINTVLEEIRAHNRRIYIIIAIDHADPAQTAKRDKYNAKDMGADINTSCPITPKLVIAHLSRGITEKIASHAEETEEITEEPTPKTNWLSRIFSAIISRRK